ncbi:MAG: glycosyltransferase [Ignavibacteriales bacterium]
MNKTSRQWDLDWSPVHGIEMVIVIPAIGEYENIKRLLLSLAECDQDYLKKSLIVFVINHNSESGQQIKDDNFKSIELLQKIISQANQDEFTNKILSAGIRIGMIDAASDGKEFKSEKNGVGLARKIGMDSSLQVFDYSLPSKKIIVSLDADCIVDKNYLSAIHSSFNELNLSAATLEFEHNLSEEGINKSAILSYEIYLRHYVCGLLFAGSSYSFHSIGSIMAFDHEAYIKLGGMNKRQAAEDFYFLQKLTKVFKIHRISSTTVHPSARESWRVPFGTGRSIADFNTNGKQIMLYDSDVYIILKDWLTLFNSDMALHPDILLKEVKKIHKELFNFLEEKDFAKDWNRILDNCKTEKQLIYQRQNWFDGFKTLKLIHHLRDTTFPMLNIHDGVEKFFNLVDHSYKPNLIAEHKIEMLENYLSGLQTLENSLAYNSAIHSSESLAV